MKIEQLYEMHKLIIFKLAHRFTAPGLEFEELVGMGNLIFVECWNDYDPRMGVFSTHLYSRVKWAFLNESTFNRQAARRTKTFQSGIDKDDNYELSNSGGFSNWNPPCVNVETVALDDRRNPDRLLRFKQTLEQLTEDAADVVYLAFYTPAEILADFPRINKSAIRQYLLKIWHGENVQNRISDAFKEIAVALKNL